MNTSKIVSLREILIRIEAADKALEEAVQIAWRADYADFSKALETRSLAVEHIRAQVARRLFELEQLEVEHGLSHTTQVR